MEKQNQLCLKLVSTIYGGSFAIAILFPLFIRWFQGKSLSPIEILLALLVIDTLIVFDLVFVPYACNKLLELQNAPNIKQQFYEHLSRDAKPIIQDITRLFIKITLIMLILYIVITFASWIIG